MESSITRDGSIYFMHLSTAPKHRFQTFRSSLRRGVYGPAEALPFSDGSVTTVDAAVASNESFMVFAGGFRPELGLDLFIAFRGNGSWSNPEHLGDEIDSPGSEAEVRLAPHQRSIYFSSSRPAPGYAALDNGRYNIWSVSVDKWVRRNAACASAPSSAECVDAAPVTAGP